ncbi:MAG: hypothetical protein AAF489_13170 [Bacteroidota bacterium]
MNRIKLKSILFLIMLSASSFCWSQGGTRIARPYDMVDMIRQGRINEIERSRQMMPRSAMGNPETIRSRTQVDPTLVRTMGQFYRFMDAARSANDLYHSSLALSNEECTPDFETSASRMMPTGCFEDNACQSCYQSAIANLNVIRRSLQRLSCIYSNTKKFNTSAVAFGDNVSGVHGALGIAWQTERKGIMDQFEAFQRTYDTKYTELMTALDRNLQSINACENEHGMQDWYQRAGFIYFELMKEKYKRID